jgi:hypothetical protein
MPRGNPARAIAISVMVFLLAFLVWGCSSGSAPEGKGWPPGGIPDMARAAMERAQGWQSDAVLVGIDVQLLPGMSVGEYFDSPEGKYSISFSFARRPLRKA